MSETHLADPRVERLARLVPAFARRLALEREPAGLRGWHAEIGAACIFADISGFTPLVEALARRGKSGLEQLQLTLNRCFEPLVGCVESFGGEVLRYAGDAMTVIFPHRADAGEALLDAMACALGLQRVMAEAVARLPRGLPPLGLKVGVGAGRVSLALVGDLRMDLVMDGPALERAVEAEHGLARGEVGVETESLEGLGPAWARPAGEARGGHAWILGGAREVEARLATRKRFEGRGGAFPTLERLAPFVLEPLYRRVLGGALDLLYEHRRAQVLPWRSRSRGTRRGARRWS